MRINDYYMIFMVFFKRLKRLIGIECIREQHGDDDFEQFLYFFFQCLERLMGIKRTKEQHISKLKFVLSL